MICSKPVKKIVGTERNKAWKEALWALANFESDIARCEGIECNSQHVIKPVDFIERIIGIVALWNHFPSRYAPFVQYLRIQVGREKVCTSLLFSESYQACEIISCLYDSDSSIEPNVIQQLFKLPCHWTLLETSPRALSRHFFHSSRTTLQYFSW